jgi:hypothetical protein
MDHNIGFKKNAIFSPKIGENIFKILTLAPDLNVRVTLEQGSKLCYL